MAPRLQLGRTAATQETRSLRERVDKLVIVKVVTAYKSSRGRYMTPTASMVTPSPLHSFNRKGGGNGTWRHMETPGHTSHSCLSVSSYKDISKSERRRLR